MINIMIIKAITVLLRLSKCYLSKGKQVTSFPLREQKTLYTKSLIPFSGKQALPKLLRASHNSLTAQTINRNLQLQLHNTTYHLLFWLCVYNNGNC